MQKEIMPSLIQMIQKECSCQKTAYHFLGGLIKHAYNYTAIMNPTVNSYKRLVPGYEAPVYIAWAGRNRSPLVRVPASRAMGNSSWVAFSWSNGKPIYRYDSSFEVGLHGIENKIEAPAPIEENIYIMTAEERKEAGITDLPSTLHNAWKLWQKMRLSEQLLENISILVSLKPSEQNGQAMQPSFHNGKLIII